MLLLSRKKNEVIYLGPDITLIVVEIRGDKVRLGIEAPPEVEIIRGELLENWDKRGKKPRPPGAGNGESEPTADDSRADGAAA